MTVCAAAQFELTPPPELCSPGAPDWYVGVWHPQRPVEARVPPGIGTPLEGGNWWLCSSPRSPLVFSGEGVTGAFKGYLLEPPLWTWSPAPARAAYWSREAGRDHNGVFGAAVVRDGGRRLDLTVDAFGIFPLFVRRLGGAVAFATHSQLLRAGDDPLDRTAALQLVSCGYLPTGRTLNERVSRVAPGHTLEYEAGRSCARRWFDLAALPGGTEPHSEALIADAEGAFQRAVDKTLLLPAARRVLPLSSGDDSRRILAALVSRGVDFDAVTVRVYDDAGQDLDGPYAAAMAREFRFPHTVLDLPAPDVFAGDRVRALERFDYAVLEHAWMLPMARQWTTAGAVVFDGLAGDVLAWCGYLEEHVTGGAPEEVLDLAAALAIPERLSRALDPAFWPSPLAARRDFVEFTSDLPLNGNRADHAFLRTRTRGGPGLAAQVLAPSGTCVVYPYVELDHVRVLQRSSSMARLRAPLQGLCLERYWPAFFRFPGSRRPPPPAAPRTDVARALSRAGLARLREAVHEVGGDARLAAMLSRSGRLVARLAATIPAAGDRASWWLTAAMAVSAWSRRPESIRAHEQRAHAQKEEP